MRTILFALLCILPVTSYPAGVYKYVAPDGSIQYTDRPVSGAARVRLYGTGAPEILNPGPASGDAEPVELDTGPYESFEIAVPEPNATIRNEEGEVVVSLILDPPLEAGHSLQILLDEQVVPGEVKGSQTLLTEVVLGSHKVQARVIDDFDVPIAQTEVVDFHLRKPVPAPALP